MERTETSLPPVILSLVLHLQGTQGARVDIALQPSDLGRPADRLIEEYVADALGALLAYPLKPGKPGHTLYIRRPARYTAPLTSPFSSDLSANVAYRRAFRQALGEFREKQAKANAAMAALARCGEEY
jgi:hypothetical protein